MSGNKIPIGRPELRIGGPLERLFYVVFDLDGTLADDRHRLHLIEGGEKRWDEYFARCDEDAEIGPMTRLFRVLQKSQNGWMEIWTGRSETVRDETVKWLTDHFIWPDVLLMRAKNDFRSNTDLKAGWLAAAPRKPDLAIDDNMDVIDWWRRNGVMALALDDKRY